MDDYLAQLAAQDPEFAAFLKEQDQRLADPVKAWRERFHEQDKSEEAKIRRACIPLIARAFQLAMNDLRAEFKSADEVVKEHLRRELRSLTRRARLRRWSRADIDRFIQSKPKVQP
jgi:hypothetical protein